jgi:signal peptidase II
MFKTVSISNKAIFLVFLVLFLDQAFKIWVKTHMMLGDEIHIAGSWFVLHFTENNGMAFGMQFGGRIGKIILSLFRIGAIFIIGLYLVHLVKQGAKNGYILSVSLVFAGAIGNTLDGMFYGLIFNDSYGRIATAFSSEGGYSSFLFGKVVDMLYFPIIHGHYPAWIPFLGGTDFYFFRHIFNLADSSIFLGVVFILIFQKRFFGKKAG